jgi:hypothetical protein
MGGRVTVNPTEEEESAEATKGRMPLIFFPMLLVLELLVLLLLTALWLLLVAVLMAPLGVCESSSRRDQ